MRELESQMVLLYLILQEIVGHSIPQIARPISSSHQLPDVSIDDDKFVMMTIRSHDQYNTTIYDLHDRYRGIHGNRRIVLMNANDMIERGWKSRHIVDIVSHISKEVKGEVMVGKLSHMIFPKGNIATYFPEANVLVPLRFNCRKIKHSHFEVDYL